jgi:cell division protein ZapA
LFATLLLADELHEAESRATLAPASDDARSAEALEQLAEQLEQLAERLETAGKDPYIGFGGAARHEPTEHP